MQKDEIITIRTNTMVKKMVEDAKTNSGQTAGDWLQQAVVAWQEKHSDVAGAVEVADSAHIVAGRKALSEVGKILEALELVVKQTAESGRQDNINWQRKYSELEEALAAKDEELKSVKEAAKTSDKEYKTTITGLEKNLNKQEQVIAELEANKESIKEVTKLLEQERVAALKVYNAREELLKSNAELQDKFKKLQMDNQQQQNVISNLNISVTELSSSNKQLAEEQLQKERQIMQLTLAKNYADDSVTQLQSNVQTLAAQLEAAKQENLTLITQKSEMLGELNALRRNRQEGNNHG